MQFPITHKNDSYQIIKNIKNNIKNNGIVYISVFSLEDPKFSKYSTSSDFEILDNNILHNKVNDTYVSFFSKDEVLNLFSDFKTIFISEEYCLEQNVETPRYAGAIKYIGQKL